MNKHQKHTNLVRRDNDNFAPNEIAILGTNCSNISNLVHNVSQKLATYKLAYFDASHAKEVKENKLSEYVFHHEGNLQVTTFGEVNKYRQRLDFAQHDFVFINGNHYQGAKQILVLDKAKEASVLKRLDQLDNIQFVIKLKAETDFFPFLLEKYPKIKNVACFLIDDIDSIANRIEDVIKQKIASIKGLVLIGGKSTRMGFNKSELNYHGKPQKQFAKELLENNNLQTFYAVRSFDFAQVDNKDENDISSEVEKFHDEIADTFLNLGPFGGICSAFQKDPNSAWLVLATDVPFINNEVIQLLLKHRNPSKVATAIKGKSNPFVEPLITIFEPKAYPILLQYLAQGYSCPRKMLINSEVEIVEVEDDLIRNINTPEEFEAAKKEINSN